MLNLLKEEFAKRKFKSLLLGTAIYMVFVVLMRVIILSTSLDLNIKFFSAHIVFIDLVFVLCLILFIWCIYLLRLLWECYEKNISKIIISIAMGLAILFMLFACVIYFFSRIDNGYYEFKSDDGKNTAIVHEDSFLFSTSLDLYKRENTFFARKIEDDFYTNDQGYVLGSDACETEWDGAVFKIEIHQRFGPYNYEYNLNDY
ncbi:hypothetical protein [Fenollaria timonensis]|uniref:hypothetical protein n=1 Tax=Fenollaria timonensis TaxID=1723384 RepID=UPI0026EA9240|nr:hypothetical protein [Fenollaria timonensis]